MNIKWQTIKKFKDIKYEKGCKMLKILIKLR